jgi:hypothetical protein
MQSRTSLIVVTAVVSAVGTSLLWLAGLGLAYWYFVGSGAPPFAVSIEAPSEAVIGQPVNLKMKVINPTDQNLELGSIDVYDSLLKGFEIVGIDPAPVDRDSAFGFQTFYYSRTLSPGESWEMTLGLKPVKEGVWTGEVDFCTPGEKFVTSSVTIRVKPGGGS